MYIYIMFGNFHVKSQVFSHFLYLQHFNCTLANTSKLFMMQEMSILVCVMY